MIRCNGSCSGRRAVHERSTPVGETDPSAGPATRSSDASESIAELSIKARWSKCGRCRNGMWIDDKQGLAMEASSGAAAAFVTGEDAG
jgi:hypothetical protein